MIGESQELPLICLLCDVARTDVSKVRPERPVVRIWFWLLQQIQRETAALNGGGTEGATHHRI